eukprot:g25438.t1
MVSIIRHDRHQGLIRQEVIRGVDEEGEDSNEKAPPLNREHLKFLGDGWLKGAREYHFQLSGKGWRACIDRWFVYGV